MKAKRHIARFTAAWLACAALLNGAASADSVTVTADRLNMRKEASASSKAVAVVTSGETLSFISESDGWYQVKSDKKTGFVMKNYVTLDESAIAADVQANTQAYSPEKSGQATGRVNMRALPMSDAKVLKVVPARGRVDVTGVCGAWYAVRYDGAQGYILGQYITLEEAGAQVDQPKEEAPSAESTYESTYESAVSGQTTARVNVRKQPSTSAKVAVVADKNQTVSVLGESGSWYKVSVSGKEGYIARTYVTLADALVASTPQPQAAAEPDAQSGEVLYAAAKAGRATARVNVRKQPSTSAKVAVVADKNQVVSVLGESGSWYKVSVSGKEGYIASNYVSITEDSAQLESEPTGGEAVPSQDVPAQEDAAQGDVEYDQARSGQTTARVNMRKGASTSAQVFRVLASGTKLSVLGEENGFYHVRYSGVEGYVAMDYVGLGGVEALAGESVYGEGRAAVTTVQVNMRRAPEGEILFTLPAGTPVVLSGEVSGWYRVNYSNSVGYIAMSYVAENASPVGSGSAAPAAPAQQNPSTSGGQTNQNTANSQTGGTTAYVTAISVNMRKGPGTTYGVIKVLTYGNEITWYSLNDGWYQIKAGEDTGYVSAKYVSATKPEAVAPAQTTTEPGSGKAVLIDWWNGGIQQIFKVGTIATVTDVDTGLSWQVKRSGGTNHADVQPLTAADTAKMRQAYNGKWSWDRHAIWVSINGVRYAASMNGMPHGTGSIKDNNFDGHHCIHFLNSRTHTGNRLDAAHQSAVQKAYKAGQ